MSLGDTIKQMRVKRMKASAVSIVPKGAATGSDGYMIQAAPELVSGADRPMLVQHVARQISGLDGDERKTAIDQFLAVLEQGAVAEELAEIRAGWPDYELWDAFCEAYYDAKNDDDKRAAITDFGAVLTRELIPVDGTVQQGDTMPEETTTPTTETTQTPAGEAVTQEATTTPEASTENAPAVLTQSDVESLIQSALAPLAEKLSTTETSLTDANAVIEQQKTEIAQLKSKTAPASRQPDAEPTGAVTQAQPETNPYANSGLHHYLTQHFPNTR